MSTGYNSAATVQQLAEAVAMDPKLKGEIYSRILEASSMQHNAFERFTSEVNPKTQVAGGVRSIFAKKSDLKAGGGSVVNFNVIGPPGGPGVMGSDELTGNTSSSIMATYGVEVGWHRDGFELDREIIEFLSAGRSLVETTTDLLSQKMGLFKQNHQMMRLIKGADGNIFRPNNRPSYNALTMDDTVDLPSVLSARARLRTIGGRPLSHKTSDTGSIVEGYLIFLTEMAMLSIRNDSSFQTAMANGADRGANNPLFSGTLVNWQGVPFYELGIVDMPWDDYIGSPMLPKAVLGKNKSAGTTIFDGDTAAPKLYTNDANLKSRYFQFFKGYDYKFQKNQAGVSDTGKYYAWIINPDGSLGFVEYTGSGNNGNQITIDKILSPTANSTGKRATTVGNLSVNTTANPDVWTGGNATIPATGANGAWTYTDTFKAGAMILQANANGATTGYGFDFGAMASCFATGRIAMSGIEQTRDFGFILGKGFEMIFGTGLVKDPYKKPVGYLLIEHAVEHEGYPTPSYVSPA